MAWGGAAGLHFAPLPWHRWPPAAYEQFVRTCPQDITVTSVVGHKGFDCWFCCVRYLILCFLLLLQIVYHKYPPRTTNRGEYSARRVRCTREQIFNLQLPHTHTHVNVRWLVAARECDRKQTNKRRQTTGGYYTEQTQQHRAQQVNSQQRLSTDDFFFQISSTSIKAQRVYTHSSNLRCMCVRGRMWQG